MAPGHRLRRPSSVHEEIRAGAGRPRCGSRAGHNQPNQGGCYDFFDNPCRRLGHADGYHRGVHVSAGNSGAWMAKTRGRGMVTWFLLCMVLPLIAHIVLLALPRRYRWTCPACEGGLPHGKVQRCMHCGHIFKRNMPQEARGRPRALSPGPGGIGRCFRYSSRRCGW